MGLSHLLVGLYDHIQFDLTTLGDNGLLDVPGIQFDINLITFFNTINPHISYNLMLETTSKVGLGLVQVQLKMEKT